MITCEVLIPLRGWISRIGGEFVVVGEEIFCVGLVFWLSWLPAPDAVITSAEPCFSVVVVAAVSLVAEPEVVAEYLVYYWQYRGLSYY